MDSIKKLSFLFLIIVALLLSIWAYNRKDNDKMDLLPEKEYIATMTNKDEINKVSVSKEKKTNIIKLFYDNGIKILDKEEYLKIEPLNYISFNNKDGNICLIIYESNNNTYVEKYSKGKNIETYILKESKLLKGIYDILK